VTRTGELGTTLAATTNTMVFLRSLRRLLVAASVVPSSSILVTLMKEALSSSETSVLTRATRRSIPEDGIVRNERWPLTLDNPLGHYRSSNSNCKVGEHEQTNKQTPLPLVRERTIQTERRHLSTKFSTIFCG
jgi:hypothetical protein